MTSQEKNKIIELNNQGLGYSKIAATLNLPLNTVKSYIQRLRNKQNGACLMCGARFKVTPGIKPRKMAAFV